MKMRDSDMYLGVMTWTAMSVTMAMRIVGRRMSHFLRHSAAPSAGRSSSVSADGIPLRGDCEATLISRLPTTEPARGPQRRKRLEIIKVANRLRVSPSRRDIGGVRLY